MMFYDVVLCTYVLVKSQKCTIVRALYECECDDVEFYKSTILSYVVRSKCGVRSWSWKLELELRWSERWAVGRSERVRRSKLHAKYLLVGQIFFDLSTP